LFFRVIAQEQQQLADKDDKKLAVPNKFAKEKLREKFKQKPRNVRNVVTLDEYSLK